ncbi:MAG: acyl-ACP--UDP-N-acetylglucosamine O-acyltransferase [Pseudomonadales bacterium]|nr:acyl-ACP--UDP-N-acetylglucosamine O-acyltransferase [Pseudomonadales bacterium]
MGGQEALIHPSARIGRDVEIGPWTVIGPEVVIGDACKIASHVIIRSHTILGRNNRVFQFSSVGEDPSDKKYHGEVSWLEIGDDNTVREGVTIHRGTGGGGGLTRIGSNNLLMPYAHVAHDCTVGDHTVFANNAAISGHVEVADWAILGGYSGVNQFLKIGAHSFVGGFTHINMDVPAYIIVNGNPPAPRGINSIGLERRGFTAADIRSLRKAYKILYRQGFRLEESLSHLEDMVAECVHIRFLIDSLNAASRGIIR